MVAHACAAVHVLLYTCMWLHVCLWGSCGALHACVVVCVRFRTRVRLCVCGCTRMQLYMCGCTRVCGCSCLVHMYVVVCVSVRLLWGSTCVCGCVCVVPHACAAIHVWLHTRVRLFMPCCTHVCGCMCVSGAPMRLYMRVWLCVCGSTRVCGCMCVVPHACAAVHVWLHMCVWLFMPCCSHVCGCMCVCGAPVGLYIRVWLCVCGSTRVWSCTCVVVHACAAVRALLYTCM